MSLTFQKNKENFICGHCQHQVVGNGYTNHCPKCLWSKHVDVNPGDRLHECQGMMQPIRVEKQADEYILIHKCENCGQEKKNKTAKEDNFEEMLKIINI